MSLARIVARIALVEALRDKTLAGPHVYDSKIGAIEFDAEGRPNIGEGEKRPFVSVYCEASKVESTDLRSLIHNGETAITFEWGVTEGMLANDPNTGESRTFAGLAPTDDALEFELDLIGRQIADALTDPDNAWAEIYRSTHYKVLKIERARVSNDQDGQRLAAHQLRLTVDMIDDPVRGEEMPEPFVEFLALLDGAADTDMNKIAALMRSQITATSEPWEDLQRRKSMTAGELLAVGQGPLAGDVDRITPPFDRAEIDMSGTAQAVIE